MMKAIVKHKENFTRVSHACGEIREISRTGKMDAALAIITDARKHYHKKSTEFYYVLSGSGTIELDKEKHPISKGSSIIIPPGIRHRAKARKGTKMRILVVSSPPYDKNDQFCD